MMASRTYLILVVAIVSLCASGVATADPALHERIDRAISAKADYLQKASPLADDAEFLRRITLDLTGTIPTADEARAFFADRDPNKRTRLIDKLLGSAEHARHLAHVFDVMLMERLAGNAVPQAQWHEFLRESIQANKPWDQMVREILSADGTDTKQRGPAKFFLERKGEPDVLTRDVSRLLLGKNLECAQCHDHPIVLHYLQSHYYGIYAFLQRTSMVTDTKLKLAVLSEKADGDTTYQNVFDTTKATKSSLPRVLDLPTVKDPKVEKGKEYITKPAKGQASVPSYSRRAQLAGQITSPGNAALRRNIVNRLWAMMMGRGLVHPLDMDHEDNPPSHPELLDDLAEEFLTTKYDIRHLLRELALSQTYQRSSRLREGVVESDPAAYIAAGLKPLSPEQMAFGLMQATGLSDVQRTALGAKLNEAALYASLSRSATPLIAAMTGSPGEPESFEATIDQALFFANGPLVRSWIQPRAGNLSDRLMKAKSDEDLADELFLSVFTRLPEADEKRLLGEYLAGRKADRAGAIGEIIWAMLTSTEFRFNH